MASWLDRLVSKVTFWDKNDDQRVAREDEEERRRRNRAAVSTAQQSRPVQFQPPSTSMFQTNSPLQKVNQSANPLLKKPEQPDNPLGLGSQSQFKLEKPQDTRSDTQKELEDLAAQNLDQARKDSTQGQNWLQRTFLNSKSNEERAIAQARNRATSQYQDKHGWNADPEVLKFNEGTTGRLRKESSRLAKEGEKLQKTRDFMEEWVDVASKVPIIGSVPAGIVKTGTFATEGIARATGNNAYADDLSKSRTRMQLGMSQEEFDSLPEEQQEKLRVMQGIDLAAAPLDYVGVGAIAKAPIFGATKQAAKDVIKRGAVTQTTKQMLKESSKVAGRDMAIGAVAGGGISAGAQGYLAGEIDPAQVAKDSTIGAMLSPLFSGASRRGRSSNASGLVKANEVTPEGSTIGGIKKVTEAEESVSVGGGMKSNNIRKVQSGEGGTTRAQSQQQPGAPRPAAPEEPRIPDVRNPRALAKADTSVEQAPQAMPTQEEVPIADFANAIRAEEAVPNTEVAPQPLPVEAQPTPTDIAEQANAGDLRVSTRTDVDGNPALISDAQAARELAEAGVVPQRGNSPVQSTEEAMASAAQQAALDEVQGIAAPRTRERIVSRVNDEQLREDLMSDVPLRDQVSLEDAELNSHQIINNMSDGDLVARYSDEVVVSDPQSFYTALNSIRRLEQIDAPEAELAIRNALDGMTEYASRSGRGLRTTQIVFEDMPTTMKVDYLMNKIKKAGGEMDDYTRGELLRRIQASDEAADRVRALEAEGESLLGGGTINNESMAPDVRARALNIADEVSEANRAKEYAQGEAWNYYQQSLPKSTIGQRAGEVGRTLMLSSPSGRVFDVLSTTATTIDDSLQRGVSGLIGKAVNRFRGDGTVQDTVFDTRSSLSGLGEGAMDIKDSFMGRDRVASILDEANRNTRGNVNTGGGRLRKLVNTMVEAPTNLTRGIQEEELFRSSMQEAARLGLKGEARDTYARLRASIPSEQQFRQAEQSWKKANMLHDNPISRQLNNLASSLDKRGGGWAAPFLRNQVAPFTSWLGGNLHRSVTDKNVLHNAYKIIDGARKGDAQMVVDNISKLAVNTAQGYALGYALTEAGLITTEDANGDSYGGLYFHIGDRYFPVAIAGTSSVPLILGNAVHQGMNGEDGFNNGAMNLLKNAGVSSVFGGDNNLQRAISDATSEGGNFVDGATRYLGNLGRQYIPGVTGDVNAVIDQMPGFNETGEAAETKATFTNPETGREKTDVFQTEINKTLNRLPFASQAMLERKEGVPAKDLLDRVLKGNRETGEMSTERERTQTLEQAEKQLISEGVPLKAEAIADALDDGNFESAIRGLEYNLAKLESDPEASNRSKDRARDNLLQAQLRSEGVPITDAGIDARREDGDFARAALGLQYQLQKVENDDQIPESRKQKLRQEIGRMEIYRDGDYDTDIVRAYEASSSADGGVGVTAWRAMMSSGDPKLVEAGKRLAALDEKLYDAGLIPKPKYYWKGGSGGSGGGRGGKSSTPKVNTSIATNSLAKAFTPQKAQAANYGERKSAIPKIEKVANNDRSKIRKITVTKGNRT